MARPHVLGDPRFEAFRKPYSLAMRRLLPRKDVLGVCIGYRERDDVIDSSAMVLRIRVPEKRDRKALGDREIPSVFEGMEVDIVEGVGLEPHERSFPLVSGRTDVVDVLAPGVSLGVPGGTPGTLGAFVEHPEAGLCILTADHVVAPTGHGDETRVFQPGPPDLPQDPRNQIGWVYKRLRANGVSLVRVDTPRSVEHAILGTDVVLRGTKEPELDQILTKSGRSTAVTQARVVAIGYPYRNCKPGFELRPVDDAADSEISMGGDSGAIWYDEADGMAVGVHCRGDGDDDFLTEWAQAAAIHFLAPYLSISFPVD